MKNSESLYYNDFRSLKVYQKSLEFSSDIIKLTKSFPAVERYAIIDQLNRAVTSIGANIAEGAGCGYPSKNINFCYIALGSANEVLHWLKVAEIQEYIDEANYRELVEKNEEIIRMLLGYIKSIKKSML